MADLGLPVSTFLREYSDALADDAAAAFVGAGLSRAQGYVDWKGLLREFADELDIDLDVETDLVSVAQYHVNSAGNRNRLNQKILDEFGPSLPATEAQLILAELPIATYWTSNYDNSVEKALDDRGRVHEVIASAARQTVTMRGRTAVVNKMHGDLSDPDSVIITRDDYETYVDRFPLFRERLLSDLTRKTFVFLGFSFTDPHLEFLLGEIRRAMRDNPRTHYNVMRREALTDYEGDDTRHRRALRRQQLRIQDLQRYGIQTVVVDDYSDITDVLKQLRLRYLRRQVFISGALIDTDAWTADFLRVLGQRLIKRGYNLVSGFGLGVGSHVVFGALEQLYQQGATDIDRRLSLRPFPQGDDARALYPEYRRSMLKTAGFVVVVGGTRMGENGPERSTGVDDEIDIANEFGSLVVPIGRTGHIAAELWTRFNGDLEAAYGQLIDPSPWALLADESSSVADTVEAVVKLLDELRP